MQLDMRRLRASSCRSLGDRRPEKAVMEDRNAVASRHAIAAAAAALGDDERWATDQVGTGYTQSTFSITATPFLST